MDNAAASLFILLFIVVALNFYLIVIRRIRSDNKRSRKPGRIAIDEAKQALWRDKEVQRRIDREQDDAYERVKLRNETLALYDEVRRRAAEREQEENE